MRVLWILGTGGSGFQDGKPQPPFIHRTFSRRGHRGRRHIARRFLRWVRARSPISTPCASVIQPCPFTRHIIDGVVRGIGGYGNCVGVATVGGEVNFHSSYNSNPLVNAMTVGIAAQDRIFLSAAAGVGNPVVYVGSKTGRDGIHGATMSSAEFDEHALKKRPTVQVGDPFTEKLLIEPVLNSWQQTPSWPSRIWGLQG